MIRLPVRLPPGTARPRRRGLSTRIRPPRRWTPAPPRVLRGAGGTPALAPRGSSPGGNLDHGEWLRVGPMCCVALGDGPTAGDESRAYTGSPSASPQGLRPSPPARDESRAYTGSAPARPPQPHTRAGHQEREERAPGGSNETCSGTVHCVASPHRSPGNLARRGTRFAPRPAQGRKINPTSCSTGQASLASHPISSGCPLDSRLENWTERESRDTWDGKLLRHWSSRLCGGGLD